MSNISGIPVYDALQGSPASLAGTTLFGGVTKNLIDMGYGSKTDEELFNMGQQYDYFHRYDDDTVEWNIVGLSPSISLNKPGWYIKTAAGQGGTPGSISSYALWQIGGVYDGATLIDPTTMDIHSLHASGGNYGEDREGYNSVFAIRIKNSDEGAGDVYNCFVMEKVIWHSPTLGDITYYTKQANFHMFPGAIERGLDFVIHQDPEPEPEPPGGDETTPSPSGGDGYRDADPDDTSDSVPIPDDPTIGITDAGFINVYNPAAGALTNLGNVIFPNVASATDIPTAIKSLCDAILNQNLINYVIDVHVIPCAPVTGSAQHIRVGFRDTEISAPVVTSDYVNVTCGSLNLHEYFANFADYLYTKSKLWLPFVGFVDMRPEFWQAGTIYVDYKFNVIDGSFMAYIRSTSSKSQLSQSVIASYGGNACMHFPLTGVNYSNMVSGVVGAAAAIATGGTSAAVLGAAASAANTICQGGEVQQSNGYNSTASLLGVRTPYLMIERPAPSYPRTYKHDRGFPSNITVLLGNISGYTEIEKIDLSGIPLTEQELTELRSLLSEGVYF